MLGISTTVKYSQNSSHAKPVFGKVNCSRQTSSSWPKLWNVLKFEYESEAELIREKLEQFVTNILAEVQKRDKRFQSTLIQSGNVYEGAKVCQPDEFDFMIRIDSLTDKQLFRSCDKGEGYVKLALDEQEWEEFKDDKVFFNPHMLPRFFKKLVNASLNDAELPEGLTFQWVREEMYGT